ncbi:MAG: DNA mismatch repair protein MutS [Planctomycetota bacterium]
MRAEYESRARARGEEADILRAQERRLVHVRTLLGIAALVVGWLGFVDHAISEAWTALPLLAFTVAVVRNHHVTEERIRKERARRYYEAGLQRLDGAWPGHGPEGNRFLDLAHLYAADLDLFGRGSLFQMLCRARTRAGETVLADWLRSPADPSTITARQEAVADLKERLDFREALAVIGEALEENHEPDPLRTWAQGEARPVSDGTRIVAMILPLVTIAAIVAWFLHPLGAIAALLATLVQSGFAFRHRAAVSAGVEEAEKAGGDLDLLVAFFHRVNEESLQAPLLKEMMEGRGEPEKELASLRSTLDRLETRSNPFFAPFGALLLWTTRHVFSIEGWRAAHGEQLVRWLDLAGETEALASFATFAQENPDDPFPEIVDEVVLEADEVGHPLLKRAECVRNTVALRRDEPLLLISGSNMSGKSTLLRAVGTAAVMAYAGAPVCAKRLRIGLLSVGASIVSRDSIREGTSRFYAEITRLRDIVGAAKDRPTLYLLDELLMGTNSHDRRIGAEALMRGLVATGALGLVTTHDLALTEVAGGHNVHFSDQMENGTMRFDHVLREGVVTRSNALELMRAVGLDV